MNPRSASLLLSVAFFGCCLGGCVNLRSVSSFSSEAVKGLEKYEEIPYNFTKNCQAACLDRNIRGLRVDEGNCSCEADQKADSITRVIYAAALGYFEGLVKISGGELTEVNTVPLTTLLTEGDFGPVTLNQEHVKAYSRIGTTLLRVATSGYRKQKLAEYISQAKDPIEVLLEFLDLNLSGNLTQKLEIRKLRYQDFYFDMAHDTSLSAYERLKLVEDYYQRKAEIEALQEQIAVYSKALHLLVEGHDKLAGHIHNLKGTELRQELIRYGGRLHNIIIGFTSI